MTKAPTVVASYREAPESMEDMARLAKMLGRTRSACTREATADWIRKQLRKAKR